MRRVTIPQWLANPVGRYLVVPVRVDWPELRLTEDQVMANAVACAAGQAPPFPDPASFDVALDFWPAVSLRRPSDVD